MGKFGERHQRCEISHCVIDGGSASTVSNTWEQLLMEYSEHHRDVVAYVKNDRLGFTIPYVHEGKRHHYEPDFLLRLKQREGDTVRTLIVETSGSKKRVKHFGQVEMKLAVTRDQWCVAVNNHGGFGRWGYLEITDIATAKADLDQGIQSLYADDAIVGEPQLSDWGPGGGVHSAAS